jgi:SAM-dependent methyltransferase
MEEGIAHTEIFQCPACHNQELTFGDDKISCFGCGLVFRIEGKVPLMFMEKTESVHSDFHETFGSEFDYVGHYQKDAHEFDYFEKRGGAIGHNERRVREFILKKLPPNPGLVLDVGCGGGWVATALCPKGYEVVSFDISPKNTQEVLARNPSPNHSAVAGDVFALPFQPASFDIVIASEIIEHVYDPGLFAKGLLEILKPGGTLIITTPYKEKIVYALCVHCNRPTPLSAHLHSFDEKKLATLFPKEKVSQAGYYRFANKALIHLRTHVFLKWFGFVAWRMIDRIANTLYNHPISILVKIIKK